MHLFHHDKSPAPLVDLINWKAVRFQKVTADGESMKVAYKVLIDGVVVGAIGKLKDSINRHRQWIWVEKNQSFTNFHCDDLSYSRQWATASLLFKLNKEGALAEQFTK